MAVPNSSLEAWWSITNTSRPDSASADNPPSHSRSETSTSPRGRCRCASRRGRRADAHRAETAATREGSTAGEADLDPLTRPFQHQRQGQTGADGVGVREDVAHHADRVRRVRAALQLLDHRRATTTELPQSSGRSWCHRWPQVEHVGVVLGSPAHFIRPRHTVRVRVAGRSAPCRIRARSASACRARASRSSMSRATSGSLSRTNVNVGVNRTPVPAPTLGASRPWHVPMPRPHPRSPVRRRGCRREPCRTPSRRGGPP